MLVDSLIVPECIYRPGSFTGLMTIYESNFIKLNRLLPNVTLVSYPCVSTADDDCDLYLELVRREPYTTTLKLTYWFEEANGDLVPDPDLTVRIYHDASLAEAVGGHNPHRHHLLQEIARAHSAAELDRRWRSNIMLNKWLDYLLDMGHGFGRPGA
jgi:uncharacterized protein